MFFYKIRTSWSSVWHLLEHEKSKQTLLTRSAKSTYKIELHLLWNNTISFKANLCATLSCSCTVGQVLYDFSTICQRIPYSASCPFCRGMSWPLSYWKYLVLPCLPINYVFCMISQASCLNYCTNCQEVSCLAASIVNRVLSWELQAVTRYPVHCSVRFS